MSGVSNADGSPIFSALNWTSPRLTPLTASSPDLTPLTDDAPMAPLVIGSLPDLSPLLGGLQQPAPSANGPQATAMEVDSEPFSLSPQQNTARSAIASDHENTAAKTDEIAKKLGPSSGASFHATFEDFLKDFEITPHAIAEGTMAKIIRVRKRSSGELFVIKVNKDDTTASNVARKREIEVLSHLGGKKGFPALQLAFNIAQQKIVMMTQMPPNLREVYLKPGRIPMPWDEFCCFTYQLLLRLHDLDRRGISHCNLTPEHIAYDRGNGEVSLLGFGNARTIEQLKKTTELLPSSSYCAPESLQKKSRNHGIDVWSAGCILGEMIVGKPLFPKLSHDSSHNQLQRISKLLYERTTDGKELLMKALSTYLTNIYPYVDEEQRNNFLDLAKQLLRFDQVLRIKPADALDHPFFSSKLYVDIEATPDASGQHYHLFLLHAPASSSKALADMDFRYSRTASRMMPRSKDDKYTALLVPVEGGDPITTILKIPPRAVLRICGTKIEVAPLLIEKESSQTVRQTDSKEGKDSKK